MKLMKGNHVIAEAALRAGCKFYAGYPITPQNELPEYMALHMPKYNGIFIQAESELAAINMLFGASAAGARCMTSSSSPGISLKQEGISYLAAAELPCVIVNIVRGGPGLGNIRASQADYFQSTRGGGHGDYRLIVLAPSTLQEAYDLTQHAFDYADYYRNPVLILGDGILGQMAEPVKIKEYKPILKLPKKDYVLDGCKNREPRVIKTLLLKPPDLLMKHNIHLKYKYDKIKAELNLYESLFIEDAKLIVTAYGITGRIVKAAVRNAREIGLKVGLIRPISLWPFPEQPYLSCKEQEFLVVEMSNGQFIEDVKLTLKKDIEFLGYGGGWYPTPDEILNKVKEVYNEIN